MNCLLLNLSAPTMFQWLFAEEVLSPQDSLKSRTLFAIPHNFFRGIMLSSFFKRVTPNHDSLSSAMSPSVKGEF